MKHTIKAVGPTLITALAASPALAQDEVVIEAGNETVTQTEFDERFNLALHQSRDRHNERQYCTDRL